MTPEVTIGIPTMSRPRLLAEAVAAALAQDFDSFEVIVSNDGNSAEVHDWCMAAAASNSRIVYRRNETNLGLAGNWNAIARQARGRWVVIIGDDDRLLPGFLATLVPLARQGFDVVFSNHHLIDSSGTRLPEETRAWTREFGRDQLPPGELEVPERWAWRNALPMSASLIRTEALFRFTFAEELNTPEIEMFLRLAKESGRFCFCPEYLMEFRVHPASATGGGLWNERLARRLLEIPAGPGCDAAKRAFMTPLVIDAVSRCLRAGRKDEARFFLNCGFYPSESPPNFKLKLQKWACRLPGNSGVLLYRMLWNLNKLRGKI